MEPNHLDDVILKILQHNLSEVALLWLEEKAALLMDEPNASQLNKVFVIAPRNVGHVEVTIPESELKTINELLPGFLFTGFTVDRITRIYLLMQVNKIVKEDYINKIETLFKAAEMNELAALYSALPFLAYSTDWVQRCAEGIRSNIGIVLEAIMYHNPYPAAHLGEAAWNQMVLKAFFTEKDINKIYGIDARANKALADTLIDYARERWAAHRNVNPQLWRLVSPFIDDNNIDLVTKLFLSGNAQEKYAAALACNQSNFKPAHRLLQQYPDLNTAVTNKMVNWNSLNDS